VPALTVLYDGACGLCRASAERVRRLDCGGRIELINLHAPDAEARFPQVNREEALRWMVAVDRNGRIFTGADAWAQIGLTLPGWNLLAWVLLAPGIHFLAKQVYALVARNRYRWNARLCADGSCALHTGHSERTARHDPPRS
jgi:predicted DCC family thiol-disulfide oxidoreductase YuxK